MRVNSTNTSDAYSFFRTIRVCLWVIPPPKKRAVTLMQIPVEPKRKDPVTMHEIICPHCSKAFKIDEAGYANILKHVRDGDFDKQLHERLELAEREKQGAIALAEAKLADELQGAAARKDAEIQALQA